MLKVTIAAAAQIRQAALQSGASDMALRVAATRDARGAIEYGLGFDVERANDIQIVCEGVTMLVSHHSRELLAGTVIDFVELEPGDFRFIFINPNDAGPASGTEPGAAGSTAAPG